MNEIEKLLNQIIDDVHPLFKPISDENLIEETNTYGYYTKDYLHQNGKKFRMKWKVYFGIPENVRTVFEPAETI